MKKISFLLSSMAIILFANTVNAMPMHDTPFVGINPVMEKCHIIAEEDDTFAYQGDAKTKLTINFMKRKMNEYDELKKELNK